jgi:hypothetical protein
MDPRRSFYLATRQDDFAKTATEPNTFDFTDIPYIMPANDNMRTKDSLSTRCGSLLRRLIALHGLR